MYKYESRFKKDFGDSQDIGLHIFPVQSNYLILIEASSANLEKILTENAECCVPLLLVDMYLIYQKEFEESFTFNYQNSILKRI